MGLMPRDEETCAHYHLPFEPDEDLPREPDHAGTLILDFGLPELQGIHLITVA